jgi:hypothetical protein
MSPRPSQRVTGLCFHCGRRLLDAHGRNITPVTREYWGTVIKLHQTCAEEHDKQTKRITAREVIKEDTP